MLILSSLLIILGGIAFLSSMVFATDSPLRFHFWNPRHWRPMWHPDVKKSLHPPGYALMTGGFSVFMLGMGLHWIFIGWPW